ncbi:MAG: hypothetical protein CL920_04445 [Deltaproteobacteria bacterium]|nr:hypothetical protein [Deltaproteobacteria bacterium]MBU47927.1 hypothetical protein [Deltaproteobacteria bacterium]
MQHSFPLAATTKIISPSRASPPTYNDLCVVVSLQPRAKDVVSLHLTGGDHMLDTLRKMRMT